MPCEIGDAFLHFAVSKQLDEALPGAGTDELHMRRVRAANFVDKVQASFL